MSSQAQRKPHEWDADIENLGDEVRQLRRARGLTLTELGELIGKTAGYLSLVERNKQKPSVRVLQDISEALGVNVGWFFQSDPEASDAERQYIVRAANRRRLSYSGLGSTDYLGLTDHLLSSNLDGSLALGLSRYAPGGSTGDDQYDHRGEEAGLVIQGILEISIGEDVFILEEGDSFSFPSHLPHRFHNPGETDTLVVWANTPITLRP